MSFSKTNLFYSSKYNTNSTQNDNKKLLTILSNSLLQNNVASFKKNSFLQLQITKIATHLIKTYFVTNFPTILISNPTFDNGTNKISISLFYFGNSSQSKTNSNSDSKENLLSSDQLIPLSDSLSILFEKEVNLQFIRINYPYMNSMILAQYLVKNAISNTFLHFSESILTYPTLSPDTYGIVGQDGAYILPAYITGIRLQLAGRLTTEQIVPRVTKKSSRISNPNTNSGSLLTDSGIRSETMSNVLVDYAKFTTKNELGNFTLKVWISSIQSIET